MSGVTLDLGTLRHRASVWHSLLLTPSAPAARLVSWSLEEQATIRRGSSAVDVLIGEAGDDWLYGGASDDKLRGDRGNDRLFGEQGDDWLHGRPGRDAFDGGAGREIVLLTSALLRATPRPAYPREPYHRSQARTVHLRGSAASLVQPILSILIIIGCTTGCVIPCENCVYYHELTQYFCTTCTRPRLRV